MGKIKVFESQVEELKYKVMRELARQTWADRDAFSAFNEIANGVIKKGDPPFRCCIYKDRAVIAERIRICLGEYHGSKDTVQIVEIACDECPKSGHEVTGLCRGCIAHHCREACPRDAIAIDGKGYAHIDKERCIECGRCAAACKYHAITNLIRPCENVCPVNAISMSEDGSAQIDQDKCIVCGLCIYSCPFGAPNDISSLVRVINSLKDEKKHVHAIVAPAVAAQFEGRTLGQVFQGILELGFDSVSEVAIGADDTAWEETHELLEKGFLFTSCCPAFVEYINVEFPMLSEHVSSTPSPMVMAAKRIKAQDPDSEVVFIGPCIAKKYEKKKNIACEYVDHVLTFIELYALFDSKDISLLELPEMDIQGASCYGRGFPQSGGVTAAIREGLKELGREDFPFKPVVANGLEECRLALLKAKAGKLDGNFLEGMACEGGCVRGNGTLVNKKNTSGHVNAYCEASCHKTLKSTR